MIQLRIYLQLTRRGSLTPRSCQQIRTKKRETPLLRCPANKRGQERECRSSASARVETQRAGRRTNQKQPRSLPNVIACPRRQSHAAFLPITKHSNRLRLSPWQGRQTSRLSSRRMSGRGGKHSGRADAYLSNNA